MPAPAQLTLNRIMALLRSQPAHSRVRILNVCGGHERSIMQAGLRRLLPPSLQLIPGPGCPVCVCPEEDIYTAIQIALQERAIVVAFGDMLRVPVNVASDQCRSLEQARARGADIRPVASPQHAVTIAQQHPERQVVFFAAGFETTMAPVAAMMKQGVPDNLSLLLSGRRTWPAVARLLDADNHQFDALIAPGHVATIMGPDEWNFVAERHGVPVAIGGFSADSLLAAIHAVLLQLRQQQCHVDNCYPAVVRRGGNPLARQILAEVMTVTDAPWRGLGVIPASGYVLQARRQQHDARRLFADYGSEARQRAGKMPAGCACAAVVSGRCAPVDCKLYGTSCTPQQPVGPCMVSDEGACRIWWAGGARQADRQSA